MPDTEGNAKADEETVPSTPLHAYKESRNEDVKGDADKLESNKAEDQKHDVLEADDEELHAPEKK